jgi:heptosyltransferase I
MGWNLAITEHERAAQQRLLDELDGRDFVAVVPASANASKDWNAAGYARVVDALESDFGLRTVLIGGPGARETAIAREIIERATVKPVWALGDGVRRLVWLIDAASLVIAPDTGPVHIARALETPVIGLYGHTNPWRVGPYRWCENLWVDTYNDPGAPADASLAEPKHGRMELIGAADVLERVQRWSYHGRDTLHADATVS